MRFFIIIILVGLAAGCAADVLKVDVPNLGECSSLVVEDLRPPIEKENKTFGLYVLSNAYGIYRRADELISPNPIRLLQHNQYNIYES